jgi:hypothetical protein
MLFGFDPSGSLRPDEVLVEWMERITERTNINVFILSLRRRGCDVELTFI